MTKQDGVVRLRQLFDDLVRFETTLWNAIDQQLQDDAQTTLATVNLLLVIDATPACRVQDIARALAITVGGTSQAVDRAEKAGLCARAAHPNDRRSSIVELTDAGNQLLRKAAPVFDGALAQRLGTVLDASDLSAFARALRTLRDSTSKPNTTVA